MKIDNTWKPIRGEKSTYIKELGRCSALHRPAENEWYLIAPRGVAGGADRWGPWIFDASSVEAALAMLASWERKLARAGWFKLQTRFEDGVESWSPADMQACVAKLPRCPQIPYYFRSSLDKSNAAKGCEHAVSTRGVLHVGGHDLGERIRRSFSMGPKHSLELAITDAGVEPTNHTKCLALLSLNTAEVDALIAYLIKARLGMVNDDAYQASARQAQDHSGEAGGDRDAMWRRFERMQDQSAIINSLVTSAAQMDANNLGTLAVLVDVLKSGDHIAHVAVDKASEVFTPMAISINPESMTAKGIADGIQLMHAMDEAAHSGQLH